MLWLLACGSPEPATETPSPPEPVPQPPARILELEEQLVAHARASEPERMDTLVSPGGTLWVGCLNRSADEDCESAIPAGWRVELVAGELSLAAQPTELTDWPSWLAQWDERLPTTSRNGHAVLFQDGVIYELKLGCLDKDRFEQELERFRATLPEHHPSVVVSPCGLVHLPVQTLPPRSPASSEG